MRTLTEKQQKILDFITEFSESEGVSPTVREIAKQFKISIRPVQKHIEALVAKGSLTHKPGISRGLDPVSRKPQTSVPLIGMIRAGSPSDPIENIESYISIDKEIIKNGKCFALKVKGDSMIDAGILENDIVIVRQQLIADNNDIVVAKVDGEATVKKLHRTNAEVYLKPANPAYKPIRSGHIDIIGKVVYLMRNMTR